MRAEENGNRSGPGPPPAPGSIRAESGTKEGSSARVSTGHHAPPAPPLRQVRAQARQYRIRLASLPSYFRRPDRPRHDPRSIEPPRTNAILGGQSLGRRRGPRPLPEASSSGGTRQGPQNSSGSTAPTSHSLQPTAFPVAGFGSHGRRLHRQRTREIDHHPGPSPVRSRAHPRPVAVSERSRAFASAPPPVDLPKEFHHQPRRPVEVNNPPRHRALRTEASLTLEVLAPVRPPLAPPRAAPHTEKILRFHRPAQTERQADAAPGGLSSAAPRRAAMNRSSRASPSRISRWRRA